MAYKKKEKKMKTSKTDLDCLSYITNQVKDAKSNTSQWEQNQLKWHKLRMRIKRPKTEPFIGCSNIRMPTAEIKIRKEKASLYNIGVGIRPIVQAIPNPSGNLQTATMIEKFLDHLIMNVMKFQKKLVIAIDQMLEKGFYILKPYWRTEVTTRIETFNVKDYSADEAMALYSSDIPPDMIKQFLIKTYDVDQSDWVISDNETALNYAVSEIQAGKETFDVAFKDVIYNAPDVALCDPERIFVPSDSPCNPQECDFVCHEFFLPYRQVVYNQEAKGWKNVGEIKKFRGYNPDNLKDNARDETTVQTEAALREGISFLNSNSEVVKIHEWYGWYDINNDGVEEKCIITIAPDFNVILRKITLDSHSGKYPFIKLAYEYINDRWFSHRGLPEIIEDIIKEIDIQHMMKIDNQTIRNAPMFVYRAGVVNPNLVKFIPGQGIPVQGINGLRDTIDILNNNNSNVEYSYEREQMLLETKVEELTGQPDFTLQSMINKRQPRTLGEVQMQQNSMQNVFSLNTNMFSESMSELFEMIWELWCKYGSDEYEFSYFGKDGWQPIKMSKEEIQGKYAIVVRGNDSNTNPQTRMGKAQMVMQAVSNPVALQTGVIKPHHIAEAYDLLFKEMDIPNHQRLHESPEVLFKMAQQPPPPPPPEVRINAKDLTDGEMADVLMKKNIKPDLRGRQIKAEDNKRTTNFDNIGKVASIVKP